MLLCKSFKLSRIANLAQFLGEPVYHSFFNLSRANRFSGVIGWGHKKTARSARLYAKKNSLPYIALEDGFLRSLDLGCKGNAPLSLVIDKTGIYYDAASPSDLENLLNAEGWETPDLIETARFAIREIIRNSLSKYNHGKAVDSDFCAAIPAGSVLVIDQTVGDASVSLGGADGETFHTMLKEAMANFPAGQIFVKVHPDVIAGKKKGYLADYARAAGLNLIARDYAPITLLACFDSIYTVTSQMGFEALLLNRDVHCFGMPFYAGWGLTKDRQKCERRKKIRSIEEIFAAAYLLYSRYVNPFSGQSCDIGQITEILAEQRRKNELNKGYFACLGFPAWKYPYANAYLQSTKGKIEFFKNEKKALVCALKQNGQAVVWASAITPQLQNNCNAAGIPLIRIEDGFIRSVGLGSDFHLPYSLIIDRKGIYYDPQNPSDLEDILNNIATLPNYASLMQRAKKLCDLIVSTGLTKYNITDSSISHPELPSGKKIILVPGQVEDDASVLRGGYGMTNLSLLKAARRHNPDAFIIYKPHPEVEKGNRKGQINKQEAEEYANMILSGFPMGRLLGLVQEVHTLTSLTGFEALLRGVKVHTYGGPFYAGWGLTEDEKSFSRRKARLSLDELIAGALLIYPSYYDWHTRNFCRVEDVCHRLLQNPKQKSERFWAPFARLGRNILKKIQHLS